MLTFLDIIYFILIFLMFALLAVMLLNSLFNIITLCLFNQEIDEIIKKCLKKYNYIKSQKKSLKKIKKMIKQNSQNRVINYDVAKFEYKYLICLVKNALSIIPKIEKTYEINDSYILSLDYYFRKLKLIRNIKNYSIEGVSCLIKAIIDQPVVNDKEKNLDIILEIMNSFTSKKYSMLFVYDNIDVTQKNKKEIIKKAADDYTKYENDIFLISLFLLKELKL